jgi:hypothetical protein
MNSSQTSTRRSRPVSRDGRDLRRAYRRELRRLLRRAANDSSHGDVHAVRKAITRLRSWLRLVRELIGARRFQAHNRRLRKAARALAPLRDTRVRQKTFEAIAAATAFPQTSRLLSRQARRARKVAPTVMRKVKRRLEQELAASDRLGWKKINAGDLAVALERLQAEMDSAARAARASRSVELRHTWRKRAKNYLHALGLFVREADQRRRAIARTSRLLGKDHDLAVLEAKPVAGRDQSEGRLLRSLIRARRAKLRAQFSRR